MCNGQDCGTFIHAPHRHRRPLPGAADLREVCVDGVDGAVAECRVGGSAMLNGFRLGRDWRSPCRNQMLRVCAVGRSAPRRTLSSRRAADLDQAALVGEEARDDARSDDEAQRVDGDVVAETLGQLVHFDHGRSPCVGVVGNTSHDRDRRPSRRPPPAGNPPTASAVPGPTVSYRTRSGAIRCATGGARPGAVVSDWPVGGCSDEATQRRTGSARGRKHISSGSAPRCVMRPALGERLSDGCGFRQLGRRRARSTMSSMWCDAEAAPAGRGRFS